MVLIGSPASLSPVGDVARIALRKGVRRFVSSTPSRGQRLLTPGRTGRNCSRDSRRCHDFRRAGPCEALRMIQRALGLLLFLTLTLASTTRAQEADVDAVAREASADAMGRTSVD
jgi:hypothetical protein